jgi:hypothetical protein
MGSSKTNPRILVEQSEDKNVPKMKTDDKQLRQAQIGSVQNNASVGILEVLTTVGRERYVPDDSVVTPFIQIEG